MPEKIAIVTGASRGIGAATARLLAAQRYAVCVHYAHKQAEAAAVAASIIQAGGKAIAIQADIARETDILRLFAEADTALGPVTALVNNAAAQTGGPLESMSQEMLEKTFATNITGTMLCCREALKRMRVAGGGAIVNVGSEAARFGGNRMTAYAASKAAVHTFTLGFAREAAEYGVRVNAVSPGVIDTGVHDPARADALAASIPLKRMGRPEEVAEAIAWLLSDKAAYVTGALLTVAGGR